MSDNCKRVTLVGLLACIDLVRRFVLRFCYGARNWVPIPEARIVVGDFCDCMVPLQRQHSANVFKAWKFARSVATTQILIVWIVISHGCIPGRRFLQATFQIARLHTDECQLAGLASPLDSVRHV